MKLETLIGLEFHIQLKTNSKMFCSCANDPARKEPNKNVCPICLGHPGTLPVLNENALQNAILTALALNCEVAQHSKFDRKQYFYPDLPKGYQISQYDLPIGANGQFVISKNGLTGSLEKSNLIKIKIERVHMEEDTAKLTHTGDKSLLDFNRAGMPLIEVVTMPDFSSPAEAKTFAQELQLLLRHLGVSDADMEKGQLRCDANISLRPEKDKNLYSKVEIKNINSFKSIEKALKFEEDRLAVLWKEGKYPDTKETRGWNDKKQETILQRTKEDVSDYRFFPEPDIPPLEISKKQITEIGNEMHEQPQMKRKRFVDEFAFTYEQAYTLTADKKISFYAENSISELKEWLLGLPDAEKDDWKKHKTKLNKMLSNWMINKLLPAVRTDDFIISAENFAEFITLLFSGKMNKQTAENIFTLMLKKGSDPSQLLEEGDFGGVESADLEKVVKKICKKNPQEVVAFKQGKKTLLKFFVGQVMRETKGQADAHEAEIAIKTFLK